MKETKEEQMISNMIWDVRARGLSRILERPITKEQAKDIWAFDIAKKSQD